MLSTFSKVFFFLTEPDFPVYGRCVKDPKKKRKPATAEFRCGLLNAVGAQIQHVYISTTLLRETLIPRGDNYNSNLQTSKYLLWNS